MLFFPRSEVQYVDLESGVSVGFKGMLEPEDFTKFEREIKKESESAECKLVQLTLSD